jgi:transcription antitermination factor NusG
MPLLRRETDTLPEDIFALSSDDFPWGIAHVRSRQEKVLARYLVRHRIPFYLPLREHRRMSGGRSVVSQLPIFGGYVFHRAPQVQSDLLWRSNVVASLINVIDQELLNDELEQIRSLQLRGASFEPYDDLAEGETVRIASGVFAGYHGVVERGKGHDRLIVRITLIRQAVAVEFDRRVLQRAR